MKLRNVTVGLLLALAIGCDTSDNDIDAKVSINNEPVYLLKDGGVIDLPSRIIAPGKIKVEVTTSASRGELKDLGQGLLQYTPFNGSTNDFFKFRVFNDADKIVGEDSIGIVIPTDTTQLPCTHVYVRNDSIVNITGITFFDVSLNDYSCGQPIHIARMTDPLHGSASVLDGSGTIRYEPNETFTGTDSFMYRSVVVGHVETAGYGMVYIVRLDSSSNPNCTPLAVNDLFYKTIGDTAARPYDILANDTLCDSVVNVTVTTGPRGGFASWDQFSKKLVYRNTAGFNQDDTLRYMACGTSGCSSARVIVKRN